MKLNIDELKSLNTGTRTVYDKSDIDREMRARGLISCERCIGMEKKRPRMACQEFS